MPIQACSLGRCMALSLAPHNIRVNAIGPGSIMTPVLAAVANDRAAMNRRASPRMQLRWCHVPEACVHGSVLILSLIETLASCCWSSMDGLFLAVTSCAVHRTASLMQGCTL